MDINLNDALNELVDDDGANRRPDATATSTPQAPAVPDATPAPAAAIAETTTAPAAPAATRAPAAPGTTTAPRTAAPAVTDEEPVDAPAPTTPPRGNGRRLAVASGVALLTVVGAVAAWPHGGHTAAVPASATPSATGSATASPSATLTPQPATWAFTGTDPAATVLPASDVASRCAVEPTEQVVARAGTQVHPGEVVLVGPKGAKAPAPENAAAPWRTCAVGYQRAASTATVTDAEMSRNPETLRATCAKHSGFDLAGWKYAVSDVRVNPTTNNVSDATIGFTGPGNWAVVCGLSGDSDAAVLTFLDPASTQDCIHGNAAKMQWAGAYHDHWRGSGRPSGAPTPGGRDGQDAPWRKYSHGPSYWVTAFGRVPAAAATATSGGFSVSDSAESAAMVHIGGGLAVANHTWKPEGEEADVSGAGTVNFFDRAGRKVYSCTAG